MLRSNLAPILLLISIAIVGCRARSENDAEETTLRDRIPSLLEEAEIPGLQVAVIEDGALAWHAELGVRDAERREPVTSDTVFEAASLSKPVFAYLVLKIVERGALDLDAPLHDLLPYSRFDDVERARSLTARLVLSHQTGLPNWGGDPLSFEADPGSRFGYSGEGYVYLQRVIEAWTGEDLDSLAAREIFEPLGMTNSRFTASGQMIPATGHDANGTAIPRLLTQANAASSLYTTATDYSRFIAALMAIDGPARDLLDRSLRPQIVLMGDERGGAVIPTDSAEVAESGPVLGWGLGWGLQGQGQEQVAWHWGDNGIFRAFVAWRPVDRAGIIYFANSANGLAILGDLLEPVVGDMSPTVRWLNYEQTTAPTWALRRAGLRAEAAGDYGAAIAHFQRVLEVAPEDDGLEQRIEWLRDLERVAASPVAISPERLARYAGRYGPRELSTDGTTLTYQREGRPASRLIAIDPRTFALEGLVDFRLEVVTDENGNAIKLIGRYLGGGSDESVRDTEVARGDDS